MSPYAAGHQESLRYVVEGDALSAEATLRRHIRGAVANLVERFGALGAAGLASGAELAAPQGAPAALDGGTPAAPP